jgi:hypothetical protein
MITAGVLFDPDQTLTCPLKKNPINPQKLNDSFVFIGPARIEKFLVSALNTS